jgi:hypothetical protein
MALRTIRVVVIVICVAGIAGMIVSSVAGNNNGWVVTCGLITAVSILVLMAVSTASRASAPAASSGPDDALAEAIEHRIEGLVADGADERAIRDLVRDAVRLGKGNG